jgi:phosphoglycerate dehydrogenase-like enzyme
MGKHLSFRLNKEFFPRVFFATRKRRRQESSIGNKRARPLVPQRDPAKVNDCFSSRPCFERTIVKIGIIGAGQIGGTLVRRLTALGHDVAVANSRGPASLADLRQKPTPAPSASPRYKPNCY